MANIVEFTSFPLSGVKFLDDIYQHIELIGFMPEAIGRQRPESKNIRESFCRRYRVIYEIVDQTVYIITVIHSRRKYPRDNRIK